MMVVKVLLIRVLRYTATPLILESINKDFFAFCLLCIYFFVCMFDILLVFVLGVWVFYFFGGSVFVLCVLCFFFLWVCLCLCLQLVLVGLCIQFFCGSFSGFGGSVLWGFLVCLFEFFVFKILPSSSRKLYLPGSNIFHLTLKKL